MSMGEVGRTHGAGSKNYIYRPKQTGLEYFHLPSCHISKPLHHFISISGLDTFCRKHLAKEDQLVKLVFEPWSTHIKIIPHIHHLSTVNCNVEWGFPRKRHEKFQAEL